MRLLIAKTAGFCMGVKRAIDIVLEVSRKQRKPIYSDGPLIHNPQAVKMLEARNIKVLNDLSRVSSGFLVIRTHGVTPHRRKEINRSGLEVIDATCPKVAQIQSIIKKHRRTGYSFVIIGDRGHAEVEGLLGFAEGRGFVVESKEDVESLPPMDKLCVVAQTTQSRKQFERLTCLIKERYPQSKVFDTLCESTSLRQEEALNLARQVDLMVVIGGKNSANTRRLTEISRSTGTPAYQVETGEELTPEMILPYHIIGITAGASTPQWVISGVVGRIRQIHRWKGKEWVRHIAGVVRFLIKGSIYTAGGAALLTYSTSVLEGIPIIPSSLTIAAFYVFSMHTLNRYADQRARELNRLFHTDFYQRYKPYLLGSAVGAALISLGLAFYQGWWSFALLLLAVFMGSIYSARIIPSPLSRLVALHRLKDIPASKDLFVALGWGVVVVLLPLIGAARPLLSWSTAIAFLFVLVVVYIRAIIFDIWVIQSNGLVGKEALPRIIGKEKTKGSLAVVGMVLVGVLIIGIRWELITSFGYLLMLSVGYIGLYLYLYHRRVIARETVFDVAVDGMFYLTGLLAFLWLKLG
ncbi:4-hydroxy-3-methylbut-2-enyl diphosphate reductase [bacterium (candidate division B38) B3_B38]|nr:MAG: 4-hydroxy-3-methylbut-2-enyl diphosphate reductase [bacterium (candidate division B38) B3_B38]